MAGDEPYEHRAVATYLDPTEHVPLETLQWEELLERSRAEPDAILDAFALVNLPWMREQCALAIEHGDDPREVAFILEGALHPVGIFELHHCGVIRRAILEQISREQGGAMATVAEVAAREPLPGFVHVVIRVGDRAGTRSLDLYTPTGIGEA